MAESYSVVKRGQAIQGTYGSYNGGFVREVPTKIGTTDATVTVIASIPLAELEAVMVRALVVGIKGDATAANGIHMTGVFRRAAAGNVTQVGATAGTIVEDDGGTPAIAFNANTTAQTVEVRVTGIAATTYRWECVLERIKIK